MMHDARRWLLLLVSLLTLMLLAACGTSGNGPDDGDGDDEVVVPDTTKVVDNDTADALTAVEADGTIRFSRETDVLASLEQDDVLVAGIVEGTAPHGFLRSVTDIDVQGSGEVVLQTEQATLAQAIDQADVQFRRQLESDDVAGTQHHLEGVAFVPQQGGEVFGITLNEVLVSTANAELTVDGEVAIDAGLIFDLKIDKSQPLKPATWVERLQVGAELEEEAELALTAEGSLDTSVERELTTINIASVTFFIGPVPVVIAADLTFFLAFDGSIGARVTTRVTQTASLEVGGLYERSDGWSGVNETNSSFDWQEPTFEATAQARAAAGSRLAVGLYGENGAAGTITGRAFLEAEADVTGFPLWCIYGGLNASYGYQVSLPVIGEIASHDQTFAEFREEVACAPNSDPEVEFVRPSDGDTFEEGANIEFEAEVDDAEGDPAVQWEVAGRDLSGSSTTFSLQDLCPGDHTVTMTATDAQGASASAQVTVTVVNATPEVQIVQAPESIGEGNDAAFRGTATDPTCDDPEGTQVNLDRLVWDLEDGFGGPAGAGIVTSFTEQGTKTVTLGYEDEHGATGTDTTTVDVGPFDPDADPVVTIREPNEDREYLLADAPSACRHEVAVEAQASSSVDDAELIWTYRIESGDAVEFGTGRQDTLTLTCSELPGGGKFDVHVGVHVEGESAESASATVTIRVEGMGI